MSGVVSETITGYSFRPRDLKVAEREPGISAFMRIRNGADFLERTILSHADFFDEIVAVHSQCTDMTPEILASLQQRLGPKLSVYHYADRVFPPGSDGHAATPADSPLSMVNYSNFALGRTTRRSVTKLDDDHLAIPAAVSSVAGRIREAGGCGEGMLSFSGINLIRDRSGELAVPVQDPLSGSGDIGFFDVTPETFFTHDRRFESVPRPRGARRFSGFLYWHLKYLKTGMGFANYDLAENPDSRFARRKARLEENLRTMSLAGLKRHARPGVLAETSALFVGKARYARDRGRALETEFPDASLTDALRRTVDPAYLDDIL